MQLRICMNSVMFTACSCCMLIVYLLHRYLFLAFWQAINVFRILQLQRMLTFSVMPVKYTFNLDILTFFMGIMRE